MTEDPQEYFKERFGVDCRRLGIRFEERHGDYWATSDSKFPDNCITKGVRALRVNERRVKPTTYFLQLVGEQISKNVFEPSEKNLKLLLDREKMIETDFNSDGYVAIRFNDRILGVGLYRAGVVSNKISKSRSQQLKGSLDLEN